MTRGDVQRMTRAASLYSYSYRDDALNEMSIAYNVGRRDR